MLISYEQELKLCTALLKASGMTDADADTVAKVITHSDFTGVDSHGLSRLTLFLMQMQYNCLKPVAELKKISDSGATVAFDCGNGSGIAAVNAVYDEVLIKAKEYGVAIGTGNHSANIGCASYYGWRAAKDGMICLLCCNTYALMAPFGGLEKLIGSNPIMVSFPTDKEYPVVLDMATSIAAMGKVTAAQRERKEVPDTWGLDKAGNPTTVAGKIHTLMPFGGYKGYGLAVIVDFFSTVLAQAAFGTNIGDVYKMQPEDTGFAIIMVDPSRFMPLEQFKATADVYIRMMKDSTKREGVEEIYMPGEIEFKKYEKTMAEGFELSDALIKDLSRHAVKLGLMEKDQSFEDMLAKL